MHPSIPKPSKAELPLAAQNGALAAVTFMISESVLLILIDKFEL